MYADSASYHLKKTGNGFRVEVARSEPVENSGPPASVMSCLPCDPPSGHFENKEVSTFLHFPIRYLSQGNLGLKPSTARQTGPWWIIPKSSVQETFFFSRSLSLYGSTALLTLAASRNSYTRINNCTNVSNLRFSKKSRGLETSQNSKKDEQLFLPSEQELT
jgi:hypothetical protein